MDLRSPGFDWLELLAADVAARLDDALARASWDHLLALAPLPHPPDLAAALTASRGVAQRHRAALAHRPLSISAVLAGVEARHALERSRDALVSACQAQAR